VILIDVIELVGISIGLVLKRRTLLLIDRDQEVISVLQRAFFFLLQLALSAQILVHLFEEGDRIVKFFARGRAEITSLLCRFGGFALHFLELRLKVYAGVIIDLAKDQRCLRIIRLQVERFLQVDLRFGGQIVRVGRPLTGAGVGSSLIFFEPVVEPEQIILGEF
jgi:hypothetical protein